MSDSQVRVTFQPSGRTVFVLRGTKILEAAGRAGLTIETPCGGGGTCGKCRVQVSDGVCPPTEAEKALLPAEERTEGWRLACQTAVSESTCVTIPESSLFASHPQILTTTDVLAEHHLIDFEPGETTGLCYGAAFDIGTTTLVGCLLDLRNGKECSLVSRMNPQMRFGDDVLSRIRHASMAAENLQQLRDTIVAAVGEMTDQLCRQASVQRDDLYEMTFAGNTTMQHLLCGLNVEPLGHVPFSPVQEQGLLLAATDLDLPIHRRGKVYVFPVIGGFVGGDTVAGLLATRLTEFDGPSLLVDIGTNGEIVLACEGQLWAASTAAGPAFEGARISCGMRATQGAIEKIVFNEDIELSVIGNVPPVGVCGSALVDLAAGLLDAGLLERSGRLLRPDELPKELPDLLRRRVQIADDDQVQLLLHTEGDTPLTITQRDIRELQLATGAIRAGIGILLRQAQLKPSDLQCVLIAGGFGSFIRRSRAQRIGLLPGELDHRCIRYVGNASLAGAQWALLSAEARQAAETLARQARHVDLSQDQRFQEQFADAMIFPEK